MTTTSTKKSATPKAGHNSKRTLDVIAGEIHALERRSAFDYGKLLIEAKEACEHGTWLRWLDEEFDWSPDTADNYTAAARLEAKFRTVRNLKVPMRVIYDLAGDLDDRDLPAIIEALTTLSKSAPKGKTVSVAAAENVIDLARLRARHGDYPEATLDALDALDLIPEDEWAKLAAEKLKELRPTTDEEAYRIIAEFKPSESGQQPEPDPDDAQAEQADDGVEGGEPAEQPVAPPIAKPVTKPAMTRVATDSKGSSTKSWRVEVTDEAGKVWSNGVRFAAKDEAARYMGMATWDFRNADAAIVEMRTVQSDDTPNVSYVRYDKGRRKGRITDRGEVIFQHGDCGLFHWQETTSGDVDPEGNSAHQEQSADKPREESAGAVGLEGNDINPESSAEKRMAEMAALDDASDPGPIPDCLRRTKSCAA